MSPRKDPHRAAARSAAVDASRQRRAQRVRDLQDDERFDRLRTPTARRALVVVGYLAALASGALAWADPDSLLAVAAPLVFLAGLGVAFLLDRLAREAASADDHALDERLLALRNRAMHRSYPALVLSALVALILLMVGLGDAVEQRHLQALFYAYGAAAAITPLALLTWGEHDL